LLGPVLFSGATMLLAIVAGTVAGAAAGARRREARAS
jgi:hypothetical protein